MLAIFCQLIVCFLSNFIKRIFTSEPILSNAPIDFVNQRRLTVLSAQKKQRWALFYVVMVGVLIAKLVHFGVGKGIIWGALVAFVMQWAFTIISFMRIRPHPKQMMNDMYLAMLVRWVIGIIGFVVAFLWLKLHGFGVIFGFLLMQGFIFFSLSKIR